MKLHDSIAGSNREGRLGLIVYAMPGYPDAERFAETARLLERSEIVSGVETCDPIDRDFGSHETSALKTAHLAVCGASSVTLRIDQPTVFILYEQTFARFGFSIASLIASQPGRFDAISSEASTPLSFEDRRACAEANVEIIEAITPWMDDETLRTTLTRTMANATVYLSASSTAGGRVAARLGLNAAATRAKAHRTDIKIVAGLGLRSAEDVRAMCSIAGIDAVVMGSAFVAAMAAGTCSAFLEQIGPALTRS